MVGAGSSSPPGTATAAGAGEEDEHGRERGDAPAAAARRRRAAAGGAAATAGGAASLVTLRPAMPGTVVMKFGGTSVGRRRAPQARRARIVAKREAGNRVVPC